MVIWSVNIFEEFKSAIYSWKDDGTIKLLMIWRGNFCLTSFTLKVLLVLMCTKPELFTTVKRKRQSCYLCILQEIWKVKQRGDFILTFHNMDVSRLIDDQYGEISITTLALELGVDYNMNSNDTATQHINKLGVEVKSI